MNGPAWLRTGAAALDGQGRRGIVQFIGEWEDPITGRVTPRAVFLRPEGGGTEWMVSDPHSLTQAAPHTSRPGQGRADGQAGT